MAGIENLHRPGLTTPYGLRRAKVGFRSLPFLFLYPEYKIRNISIFYSLEFYFSQRAGEGRKSLHRPGLSLRDRAKVVFSNLSIPFRIHHLYKFRELSSFLSTKLFSPKGRSGSALSPWQHMKRRLLQMTFAIVLIQFFKINRWILCLWFLYLYTIFCVFILSMTAMGVWVGCWRRCSCTKMGTW